MKKLYKVKIATYAIVVAESEMEARRIARRESEEIVSNDDFSVHCCGRFLKGDGFPGGWDEDCLPHGDIEDKTIAQYLNDSLGQEN